MNQKIIGSALIIISILLGAFVFSLQHEKTSYLDQMILESGSCFLDDGTCLHEEKNSITTTLGYALVLLLLIIGIYVTFFDKTKEQLMEHQKTITENLKQTSKEQKEKDEFLAFLKGFDEREQTVLKAIHAQDGLLQSTLRIKTGLSKAMLSVVLKDLEQKGHITRKDKGKSKQIYLKI